MLVTHCNNKNYISSRIFAALQDMIYKINSASLSNYSSLRAVNTKGFIHYRRATIDKPRPTLLLMMEQDE
jgi:hypothetical protein